MSEQLFLKNLGIRAAACKRWVWKPGMRDLAAGGICVKASPHSAVWAVDDWLSDWCELGEGECPDFSDPATVGALWAVVSDLGPSPNPTFAYHRHRAHALAGNKYGPLDLRVVVELVTALEGVRLWETGSMTSDAISASGILERVLRDLLDNFGATE